MAPISRAKTLRFFKVSGMSPEATLCANPSTIAVLPTPASPMSTGLFLVRRESTWMTRRISSSRPITGSSLSWRASAVRSRVKRSRAGRLSCSISEAPEGCCPSISFCHLCHSERSEESRPKIRPFTFVQGDILEGVKSVPLFSVSHLCPAVSEDESSGPVLRPGCLIQLLHRSVPWPTEL